MTDHTDNAQSGTPTFNAAEALDAVAESRGRAAARIHTPGWFYPLIGVLSVAACATFLLESADVRRTLLFLVVIVAVLLMVYQQRLHGSVNTTARGPRTRRLAVVFMLVVVGVVGVAALIDWVNAHWAYTAVVGLATILVTTVVGRRYDAALRDEIRQGDIA